VKNAKAALAVMFLLELACKRFPVVWVNSIAALFVPHTADSYKNVYPPCGNGFSRDVLLELACKRFPLVWVNSIAALFVPHTADSYISVFYRVDTLLLRMNPPPQQALRIS
jgi:hypothetical protein